VPPGLDNCNVPPVLTSLSLDIVGPRGVGCCENVKLPAHNTKEISLRMQFTSCEV